MMSESQNMIWMRVARLLRRCLRWETVESFRMVLRLMAWLSYWMIWRLITI